MRVLKNIFKSERGESIAEVLVAMLVVALGSVMFASMVMASNRLIERSKTAYSSYMNAHNKIEEENNDIKVTPDPSVSLKSDSDPNNGDTVNIHVSGSEEVELYKTDKDTDTYEYFIYEPKKSGD